MFPMVSRVSVVARIALGALLVILGPIIGSTATAVAATGTGTTGTPQPSRSATAEPAHRLQWNYPEFRTWEYFATGGVYAVSLAFELAGPFPDDRWNGPILFDSAVRRAVRSDTEAGRTRADLVSDFFWHGNQYFPWLDMVITPLLTDDWNLDVAGQGTLLNWQAAAVGFFVTRGLHRVVGRARPSKYGCSDDPDAENACAERRGPSFISGHTSMGAVGAGLTCAHRLHLPLYGGGWADYAICGVAATTALSGGCPPDSGRQTLGVGCHRWRRAGRSDWVRHPLAASLWAREAKCHRPAWKAGEYSFRTLGGLRRPRRAGPRSSVTAPPAQGSAEATAARVLRVDC